MDTEHPLHVVCINLSKSTKKFPCKKVFICIAQKRLVSKTFVLWGFFLSLKLPSITNDSDLQNRMMFEK
jgi:hypothetical protein